MSHKINIQRMAVMFCHILLFYFVSLSKIQAQSVGGLVTISSSVPANLTVCGQSKLFTVSFNNPTPFLIQNPVVTIVMPPGMNYQAGSIIGATIQSVSSNTLVFLLSNMATLTNRSLTFIAFADCDIIPFLFAGNVSDNYVRLNYTKSGTPYYDAHTTANYTVKQPNLSITSVTNQTHSGVIGDVFTRCITIVNGGLGELSELKLTDVHGSGLQVAAVSGGGSRTTVGNTETITFNGVDFASVGNGNALFETGESITVCETIHVINCIAAQSDYKAFWGCNGKQCQYSTSSGNVTFPGLIPNLVLVPKSSLNSCIAAGNASPQTLKIYNNGTGPAINTAIYISQSPTYENTYIDMSSLTIQVGSSSTPSLITPTSYTTAGATPCMAAGSIRHVNLNIPTINVGDTIYIKWNTYSCCNSNTNCSSGSSSYYLNGWQYGGVYHNVCQNSYIIQNAVGRSYSSIGAPLINNNNPTTMNDGQTATFDFLFTDYTFNYPQGPGAYWKITFTIPPCLAYSGNLNVIRANGSMTWTPNSVTTVGNVVTAIFNTMPPFDLTQSNLHIDLTTNCSGCSSNSGAVGIQIAYVPNGSCGCETTFSCLNSTPITINCPLNPCPEGMVFRGFSFKRTNYGLPDNEANGGNGLPDASGSLNFSKIRTDRAMYKDTITATFQGTVRTSTAFPNWQYCYATSSITSGNRLTFLNAELSIYRGGVLIANCTNFTPTVTASSSIRVFKYDLSVPTLTSCLPLGFVYSNNDSVIFQPQYVVSSNIGNAAMLNCFSTNEYYMSPVTTPTTSANKYQCLDQNANCSILGYYFTTYASDILYGKSCNIITVSENYYLSIGPCCNNYAGGNLFPYEYRNWAHIDTLRVTTPANYDFISATFINYRTSGTGSSATSTSSIVPVSVATNTLVFDAESLFSGYGGSIPLSDDGFHGTLQVRLRATCATVQDVAQSVKYNWTYAPIPKLTGIGSYNIRTTESDNLTYDGPEIVMQANLLSVNVPNDTTGWEVSLTNNSAANAYNVWIAAPSISGVSITKLYDTDNHTLITPVGGIFQLGALNSVSIRHFLLVADFTSCLPDSIIAYSGWNCSGYPTTLASYPCTPTKLTLKETPLLPNLVTIAEGPSSGIALCDTATYVVSIKNVQLGSAYQISLYATMPVGVAIIPGTSMLSYPTVNSFSLISNPSLVSGTIWRWDISATNSILGVGGIKGILDSLFSKITLKFKVIASCGYTSGSAINFNTKAYAACHSPTGDEVSLSSNLSILGATPPYSATVKLKSNFITPCHSSNSMRVVIRNNGPLPFQNTDSVIVTLPYGVSYVTSSFSGIHNSPSNSIPSQHTLNGEDFLEWKLPSNVAVGDSCVFTFNYQGDPSKLACAISEFKAKTIVKQVLTCLAGSNCDIGVATGDTSLTVFTYKPYLSLQNGTVTAVPYLSSGETVSVWFDIFNVGEGIRAGTPTIISYYYDTDGTGSYSAGDFYITRDTITVNIDSNDVYNYSTVINSPASKACNLLAVLDTSINHCSCTMSQLLLHPRLINAGMDSYICSNSTGTIGLLPTTGYTYSWSPTTGLSSALVSNPEVTGVNNTAATQTVSYVLTTNRVNCTTTDTVLLFVYPAQIITATSSTICVGQQTAVITVSGTATSYTWNTGSITTSISQSPSVTTNYTVTGTDVNHCTNTTTTNVLVNVLPTLSVTTPTICVGQQTASITVNGAISYTWNPSVTLGSLTGSMVTGTPTVTTDYSVTGMDGNGCTNTATATIIVNTLPLLTVNTPSICLGQQTATLVAGGATSYIWNTGAVTSSIVQAPIVTTDYTVTGTDNNGCTNNYTTSIVVNAIPTVSFTSVNSCINALVLLNNTSTVPAPDNIVISNWLFGVGSTTATSNDPLFGNLSYNTSGAHTITLTAISNHSCYATGTNTVMIYPQPAANFSTTSVCQLLTTQFTDLSTSTTGSISAWGWDYTNNNSIDNHHQNPDTIYAASGNYTASLIITTEYGCKDTAYVPVIVLGQAIPNFVYNPVCSGATTSYTNSTNITTNANVNGPLSYVWDFGDNTITSTQTNPSHTYSVGAHTNATYNATLTVTTSNNCITNTVIPVSVYAFPTAAFKADTACLGSATNLMDASNSYGNPLTVFTWDYLNNGITDIVLVPNTSYTFNTMGSHVINYSVTTTPAIGLTCQSHTTQSVWVNPTPVSSFTFINRCVNAQPFSFDATASSILTGSNIAFNWDFGDLNIVTGAITTHSYASASDFLVALTITSNKGCKSVVTHTVDVYAKPQITFTNTSACYKNGVLFSGITLPNSNLITSWRWDFDNQLTSIEAIGSNVSYTFATAGTQTVHLITETNHGCKDTLTQTLYVDYIPAPLFAADHPVGCPILCVTYTDNTLPIPTPGVNADWKWDFGDGTIIHSSAGVPQTHCYPDNRGNQLSVYNVKLVVTSNKGCSDSIFKASYVTVYPKPIAQYAVSPNPGNVVTPLVEFTNESSYYTKWQWIFGDGTPRDSTQLNPSHIYQDATANTYQSMLIVSNQYGCLDTARIPMEISPEFAFYIPNTFTPANDDGINDIFTGKGIGIIEYEMWIFDRWGAQIYHTNDISRGWDGTVQGKSDEKKQDVYVWKVKLKDVFNVTHNYIGHVTLLR